MNSTLLSERSSRCLLIAEVGNNHQGSLEVALRCVEAAATAGADMVKFQKRHMPSIFTAKGMARSYDGRNSFGPTYGEHRERLELTLSDMAELKVFAESRSLTFFASIWDERSLEDMLSLGVGVLKLPSAELTNLSLVRESARARLPLILSTGMSSLEQIDRAVEAVRKIHDNITLLHCNSTYPCPPEQIGLPVMHVLARRYGLPVGYSGHEIGLGPSVAAAAAGACMIERHFTLDRSLPGTDHACSLTAEEFSLMSCMVREAEAAMLVKEKTVTPDEIVVAGKLRKSLVTSEPLPAGHRLRREDFSFKCTGQFSEVYDIVDFEGRVLARQIDCETAITFDDLVPLSE